MIRLLVGLDHAAYTPYSCFTYSFSLTSGKIRKSLWKTKEGCDCVETPSKVDFV